MYYTQTALINHLSSSGLTATVKAYAGELKDAVKLRSSLPAALIMFISGKPTLEEPEFLFDILVVTESDVYDKKTNLENNLQLSTDIAQWLEANNEWTDTGKNYYLDPEEMEAELLLQDNRFTVIAIHLNINRNL